MADMEPRRLDVERYFVGELDSKEAAAFENHLAQCDKCNAYLKELKFEQQTFLFQHPANAFVKKVYAAKKDPWFVTVMKAFARPVIAPVLAVLIIGIAVVPFLNNKLDSEIGFKGNETDIKLIMDRSGAIQQVSTSQVFKADDKLQVLYSMSKKGFVALFSVDETGAVSFYHPEEGASSLCSVPSEAGQDLSFPGSIVLDDQKGSELVIFVKSEKSLETQNVESWIKSKLLKSKKLDKVAKELDGKSLCETCSISKALLQKSSE